MKLKKYKTSYSLNIKMKIVMKVKELANKENKENNN